MLLNPTRPRFYQEANGERLGLQPSSSMLAARSLCPQPSSSMLAASSLCPQPSSSMLAARSLCPQPSSSMLAARSLCPQPSSSMLAARSLCPQPYSDALSMVINPSRTVNRVTPQPLRITNINEEELYIPPLQRTEKSDLMNLISIHNHLTREKCWPYISELIQVADNGNLSYFQIQVLLFKLLGKTIRQIVKELGLSCNNVAETIIMRTSTGYLWTHNHRGGRKTYLSEADQVKYLCLIEEAAIDINCVPTCVATRLAVALKESRCKKAKFLLKCCGCTGLASSLKHIEPPDKHWLQKFVTSHGVRCCNAQQLEEARRICCDEKAIRSFFSTHELLLNRDPKLIFNMDETMVSSKKKFKVLAKKGMLPLTTELMKYPHLTACITINGEGSSFKPMIILPGKATLSGLEKFEGKLYLTSTSSGWINKNLFVAYCIFFISDILLYRMTLKDTIRNERILLLVDGHGSRASYLASMILAIFGIDLLVFPGHCSHLLQPFDVSVASPLKVEYKKALVNYDFAIDEGGFIKRRTKKTNRELRDMILECLLQAIDHSCTINNIRAGFEKTGIIPLDSTVPLRSQFSMNNQPVDKLYDVRTNIVNNKHLNKDKEAIATLFINENSRDPTSEELSFTINELESLVASLHRYPVDKGRVLSKFPDYIIENNHAITRIIIDPSH